MENAAHIMTDPAKGVFFFSIGIDQVSTREFAIMLVNWCRDNPGHKIRININSQGGVILDALFLLDTLNFLRSIGHHVTIAVYGRSASCAGWLLQAADVRIIGAHSWFLIHEVSSEVKGSKSALKAELARVEQLQNQTSTILCSRTGGRLTIEKIDKEIDGGRDWWLTAQEALDYGLVDEIEAVKPFAPSPATATNASQAA
jgi:ATP-dependent Clp protease protease subunit